MMMMMMATTHTCQGGHDKQHWWRSLVLTAHPPSGTQLLTQWLRWAWISWVVLAVQKLTRRDIAFLGDHSNGHTQALWIACVKPCGTTLTILQAGSPFWEVTGSPPRFIHQVHNHTTRFSDFKQVVWYSNPHTATRWDAVPRSPARKGRQRVQRRRLICHLDEACRACWYRCSVPSNHPPALWWCLGASLLILWIQQLWVLLGDPGSTTLLCLAAISL